MRLLKNISKTKSLGYAKLLSNFIFIIKLHLRCKQHKLFIKSECPHLEQHGRSCYLAKISIYPIKFSENAIITFVPCALYFACFLLNKKLGPTYNTTKQYSSNASGVTNEQTVANPSMFLLQIVSFYYKLQTRSM